VGCPIALGDFSGATVEFINVVADDGTLLGPASLNGDSLEFTPRISTGSSGGATATIDNIVTFGLTALPGFAITDFQTSESGLRSLSGNGTSDTTTISKVTVELIIDEVDGSPITPVTQDFIISLFANLAASPGDNPWNLAFGLDLNGILTQESVPFTFGATHLFVSLTNTLTTTSEDGSSAAITKDAFNVAATTIPIPTTEVPEPSSLCLVGLGVMTAYRRLRRSA
jgi:hypothetical protein